MQTDYKYIILGAGCAGLSLCYYLLKSGVTEPILLLDHRAEYTNDRTWCFWDVEPNPFTQLANHSWNQWIVNVDARRIAQHSNRHRYVHLSSLTFYEYVLGYIRQHATVQVQLGVRIRSCQSDEHNAIVKTTRYTYRSEYIFDARGLDPSSPAVQEAKRSSVWIPQQFRGLRIEAQEAVFDSSSCTLMDFDVSQERGLHFMYVLPFSPTQALIENVYMADIRVEGQDHEREIAQYLNSKFSLGSHEWRVVGTENGYIPMTTHRFTRRVAKRVYAIGTLGGQTRAASGYTFVRIQRVARAIAQALLLQDEEEIDIALDSMRTAAKRYELLDDLFLELMADCPQEFPKLYAMLFENVPADTLARFMTERSSPIDDLRLVSSLPVTTFAPRVLHKTWRHLYRKDSVPTRQVESQDRSLCPKVCANNRYLP